MNKYHERSCPVSLECNCYILSAPPPLEPAPCYLYFCPFGATCHVNETTRQPVCYCEQKCSRVFAPVCGSDGAIYSNQCMMDRMSCVRNRKIRRVSHGTCGTSPCSSFLF
ncbi:follistatin-related protein 1 [Elysia marginata]|uniref:Follistatin-related protein 1 n=1 Tax=Elysia marginata TaxID=1093978 RepID=A0AAV4ER41_9GAST|nr:follistatin-related protein 1 [Elysia marginata]